MRHDRGVPIMVATMPRWSSFSRPWLSGQTCVNADMRCVMPELIAKTMSGCAASGHQAGASALRRSGKTGCHCMAQYQREDKESRPTNVMPAAPLESGGARLRGTAVLTRERRAAGRERRGSTR